MRVAMAEVNANAMQPTLHTAAPSATAWIHCRAAGCQSNHLIASLREGSMGLVSNLSRFDQVGAENLEPATNGGKEWVTWAGIEGVATAGGKGRGSGWRGETGGRA